jgi:hypothetical protein
MHHYSRRELDRLGSYKVEIEANNAYDPTAVAVYDGQRNVGSRKRDGGKVWNRINAFILSESCLMTLELALCLIPSCLMTLEFALCLIPSCLMTLELALCSILSCYMTLELSLCLIPSCFMIFKLCIMLDSIFPYFIQIFRSHQFFHWVITIKLEQAIWNTKMLTSYTFMHKLPFFMLYTNHLRFSFFVLLLCISHLKLTIFCSLMWLIWFKARMALLLLAFAYIHYSV